MNDKEITETAREACDLLDQQREAIIRWNWTEDELRDYQLRRLRISALCRELHNPLPTFDPPGRA
ncbi:MAG TPA: hypothetical protein VGF06_12855 [Terriglobales bacterium]|jgi:hypothetical protein